jgi:hypothetical protein
MGDRAAIEKTLVRCLQAKKNAPTWALGTILLEIGGDGLAHL